MGKGYRFKRPVGFLPTKKLFLIASEGAKTEPRYFDELKPIVANRDAIIRLKQVANPNNKSKPKEVLNRLSQAATEVGIKAGDELWLVIDRDAWEESELNEVCKAAKSKGYYVALSNPCFELWLFLHLQNNRSFVDRHQCQRALGKVFPSYGTKGKGGYDPHTLIPEIEKAIARAKAIDTEPINSWPKKQATRVYLLAEKLMAGRPIGVNPFHP